MAIRKFSNISPPVALTAAVTSGATSLPVGSTSGYPVAPFTIGLDRGTPTEEVCLVNSLTATSFNVTRGFDGTSAVAHVAAAPVEHVVAALDYVEANAHVNVGHKLRIPHTWTLAGPIQLPSGDQNIILPFFVPVGSWQQVLLIEARHRIIGGTSATVTVIRNEADISGWTGIIVGQTPSTKAGPDITLNNNDRLAIRVTAISGNPVNMSFTVYLDYIMSI
jgi:hypothetical protein